MKLYASPLACSCAVQMVLFELQIPAVVEYVDIYSLPHVLIQDKSPYLDINPKGAVPALELDSGEILTEVGVILQYIADLRPQSGLLASSGTLERLRVMEWLSFIGSDVHKTIGPLFHPKMPADGKEIHRQNLRRRLSYIDSVLEKHRYLTGDSFTIADAYLFVMMGWEPYFKFDFSSFENLRKFHDLNRGRPSFSFLIEAVTPAISKMPLPDFSHVRA